MDPRSLEEGNIFRELYERPDNVVACFDLLMTRRRINTCRTPKQLKALARKLEALLDQSIDEVNSISERTSYRKKGIVSFKRPLDFSSTIRFHLLQDTIILVYDIRKAIEQELFEIDIDLGTFLLFICHSAQNTLDTLLAQGFLARGAIGCGTLLDSENLVLGTSFIDAYDHIEGQAKRPVLALELTPALLKYQNWINDYLNHIHCSVGEFLENKVYLAHGGRIYVDPAVKDRNIYELRLRVLRGLDCNDRCLFSTADFYISSLRAWSGTSSFLDESLWEHAKYREGSSQVPKECREWFEAWRKENTRRRIGLMRVDEPDETEARSNIEVED